MGENYDLYAATKRIIERLDELGDPVAADRLRAALAGSTSGEILTMLGAEFKALLQTKHRSDEELGPLLRRARDAVDDALFPMPRRLRWLRRFRLR